MFQYLPRKVQMERESLNFFLQRKTSQYRHEQTKEQKLVTWPLLQALHR